MIDMLVFRCDFMKVQNANNELQIEKIWPDFRLADLSIPLEQSIDNEGNISNISHPWESIPSSYESMAFKVFDHRYDPLDCFFIEIKASPAKLMQGHNVYGSDDIYDCSMHLLELLCMSNPSVSERLDHDTWRLHQIDITYSTRAKDTNEARLFINALQNVSYGQTKSRTGFDGTAYFGKKNSRLKKIKVYSKAQEVLETIKRNDRRVDGEIYNEIYTPELIQFSEGLVRWEVSLYARYFERLGVSTSLKDIFTKNLFTPEKLQTYWKNSTEDLFKALKGQSMKTLNNLDIKQKLRDKYSKTSAKTGKTSTVLADSAFRTFSDIRRDGWVLACESMSRSNFFRHLKMLQECGVSRAALQNMTGLNDGAQIIPFVRFIEVNFCSQYPENYVKPESKHIFQPLRLVA